MIPILYNENTTNFASFGIGALADTLSCEVTEERNGVYELVLKYPVKGLHFGEIKKERLIKDEVNSNNAGTNALASQWKTSLDDSIERVNKLFGDSCKPLAVRWRKLEEGGVNGESVAVSSGAV